MKFQIVKSDKRFDFLQEILLKNGFESSLLKSSESISCENLILPIPATRDGVKISGSNIKVKDLMLRLPKNSTIFCGKKESIIHYFGERNDIKILDYSVNEIFLLKNAELTSYGIVKILLNKINKSFNKVKVLISGFGRIGKILSKFLIKLNINVDILGHNLKDKFWITRIGANKLENLNNLKYDFIINTAPDMIFSEKIIKNIEHETCFIEVASKPGIDKEACEKFGMKYILSLGIPGKYFPQDSAEIIKESIFNIIGEK